MTRDQLLSLLRLMVDFAKTGSANVQKNFNVGMREYTTFGANEPSLINMHRTFRRMAGLPLVDEPAKIEE